jgi:hypothetical protein
MTLLLAVAGVVFVTEPLNTSRPAGRSGEGNGPIKEGAVSARLWEDPLAAVQRKPKDSPDEEKKINARSNVEHIGELRKELNARLEENQGQPILNLFVTTEGGPYAEAKETRMRDRNAIASALNVSCYVSDNEERVSYVRWTESDGTHWIPYEWFRTRAERDCLDGSVDPSRPQAVLVLWLTSEVTEGHTIRTLKQLSRAILCNDEKGNCGQGKLDEKRSTKVTFKLLGPRSSSAFRSLLEEASSQEKRLDNVAWPNHKPIEIYSPWATAMAKLLTLNLNPQKESGPCLDAETCRGWVQTILGRAGMELKHSVGSDGMLFTTLAEELERRHIRFGHDPIVLIGEWDSFYGRALSMEFRAAICNRVAKREPQLNDYLEADHRQRITENCDTLEKAVDLQVKKVRDFGHLMPYIWRYSYLRGIDGVIPGVENAAVSEPSRANRGNGSLLDIPALEPPVGASQYDYIRRLGMRIFLELNELTTKSSKEDPDERLEVKAIGVLGSDPYDTLLILQALREHFPRALYFTTDLDARLIHSKEFKWTRNVVTVSHFGLELSGYLQRDIPPFRSSYQTSAFLATLQAVGHLKPLAQCPPPLDMEWSKIPMGSAFPCGYKALLVPPKYSFDATETPRIYETGRYGAVDLSVGLPKNPEENFSLQLARLDLQKEKTTGHPPEPQEVLAIAAVFAFVAGLLLVGNQRPRRWIGAHPLPFLAIVSVFVGAAIMVAYSQLLDWVVQDHDTGEPLYGGEMPFYYYWFQGVSVWPTEFLRLIGTILAVGFLIKAWLDMQANGKEVEARFHFSGEGSQSTESHWRKFPSTSRWVWSSQDRNTDHDVEHVWSRYREAGRLHQRTLRILVLLLLYWAAQSIIWKILGEGDFIHANHCEGLCRGSFSEIIDEWMLKISVVIVVALNLSVLDAAMLCRRWIKVLMGEANKWPRKLEDDLGLPSPESLAKALELSRLELIGQRTEVVNRLIRYPFIVLLVMTVARNHVFDNWDFPLPIAFVWGINVLLAVTAALLLSRAAEQARTQALASLGTQHRRDVARGEEGKVQANLAAHVRDEIESIGSGAFMPLWQQPVVESSLYGILALLQYLYLGH